MSPSQRWSIVFVYLSKTSPFGQQDSRWLQVSPPTSSRFL